MDFSTTVSQLLFAQEILPWLFLGGTLGHELASLVCNEIQICEKRLGAQCIINL